MVCQMPIGDRASFRNGSWQMVYGCHTTWAFLALLMCFLNEPITDSAAVCAYIRQEILCP